MVKYIVLFIVLPMLLSGCVGTKPVPYDGPVETTWYWAKPDDGSNVEFYIGVIESNGVWMDPFTIGQDTSYTRLLEQGIYRLKVAGVDSKGRQGIYSLPSDTVKVGPLE